MARVAPDPTARIAQLTAVRQHIIKTKLKGPLNGHEMARLAGVTWRTVKPLIEADPHWPCLMRGSEGVAYQFEPRNFLEYWIRKLEDQKMARLSRARQLAEVAGFAPELAATGMAIDELRHLDALQVSAQRRKIEQGEYIPLADFEAVISDLLSTMQTETLALSSRLDSAGRWPPEVRTAVKEELRSLLVRLHDKLDNRLKPKTSRPRRRAQ